MFSDYARWYDLLCCASGNGIIKEPCCTYKLHAQTSTSWTLCAALTEAWPIGLRLRLDLLGLHGKIYKCFSKLGAGFLMKHVILSADEDRAVYLVPDAVADALENTVWSLPMIGCIIARMPSGSESKEGYVIRSQTSSSISINMYFHKKNLC